MVNRMNMTIEDRLAQLISNAGLPSDDGEVEDYHFLAPLHLRPSSRAYAAFNQLVDSFYRDTVAGRVDEAAQNLRRHWEYMVLNLARVCFMRRWLVVSLTKNAYANDFWLRRYNLSYSSVKLITDYLRQQGLLVHLEGKKYTKQSLRTRLFPTPEFQKQLIGFFLEAEQPIEPPYVTINDPAEGWMETLARLPEDHPDLQGMTTINEFLKDHTWACKGPVRLAYKHDAFHAGRLITDFQNLPDKKIRLRINTQIDGQGIAEVDFSANHLRLNLAVYAKEDAGDTPYEDIAELAGGVSRELVKQFITVAMGASSKNKGFSSFDRKVFDQSLLQSLMDATIKRFPKVILFEGFGTKAQALEGQILKQVMLEGVRAGKVVLPVHDASAVVRPDADWAEEAMLQAWQEQVGSDGRIRARLKTDYGEGKG
jgi:hypothetical protein